ncbi:MAG: O-antigen ligase family protein [Thermacetogeniaceae bacterium]
MNCNENIVIIKAKGYNKSYRSYWPEITICALGAGIIITLGKCMLIYIIAGIIMFIIFLKPKLGIFALLFLQIGLTRSTFELSYLEIIYILFSIVIFIGWSAKLLLVRNKKLFKSLVNLPLSLFLLVCAFSSVKALNNGVNLVDWFRSFCVFLNMLLVFVIMNEFKTKQEINELIWSFLLTSAAISINDILTVAFHGSFLDARLAGVDYISIYYLFAIMISIAIYLTAKDNFIVGMQLFFLFLFIFRLLVSFTRSYIIALILGGIVFSIFCYKNCKKIKWFHFRQRMMILILFIIFIILFCLVFGIMIKNQNKLLFNIFIRYYERFNVLNEFQSESNISILSRMSEAVAVWHFAKEQPILGHGFGFKYQYYRPNGVFYDVSYVHCVPLYFFLTLGLVGVVVIIWLIICVLKLNLLIINSEHDLYWKMLNISLLSNLIAIFAVSLVSDVVITQNTLFYLALAIGIITTTEKLVKHNKA